METNTSDKEDDHARRVQHEAILRVDNSCSPTTMYPRTEGEHKEKRRSMRTREIAGARNIVASNNGRYNPATWFPTAASNAHWDQTAGMSTRRASNGISNSLYARDAHIASRMMYPGPGPYQAFFNDLQGNFSHPSCHYDRGMLGGSSQLYALYPSLVNTFTTNHTLCARNDVVQIDENSHECEIDKGGEEDQNVACKSNDKRKKAVARERTFGSFSIHSLMNDENLPVTEDGHAIFDGVIVAYDYNSLSFLGEDAVSAEDLFKKGDKWKDLSLIWAAVRFYAFKNGFKVSRTSSSLQCSGVKSKNCTFRIGLKSTKNVKKLESGGFNHRPCWDQGVPVIITNACCKHNGTCQPVQPFDTNNIVIRDIPKNDMGYTVANGIILDFDYSTLSFTGEDATPAHSLFKVGDKWRDRALLRKALDCYAAQVGFQIITGLNCSLQCSRFGIARTVQTYYSDLGTLKAGCTFKIGMKSTDYMNGRPCWHDGINVIITQACCNHGGGCRPSPQMQAMVRARSGAFARSLNKAVLNQLCDVMKEKNEIDNETIRRVVQPHLPDGIAITAKDFLNTKRKVRQLVLPQITAGNPDMMTENSNVVAVVENHSSLSEDVSLDSSVHTFQNGVIVAFDYSSLAFSGDGATSPILLFKVGEKWKDLSLLKAALDIHADKAGFLIRKRNSYLLCSRSGTCSKSNNRKFSNSLGNLKVGCTFGVAVKSTVNRINIEGGGKRRVSRPIFDDGVNVIITKACCEHGGGCQPSPQMKEMVLCRSGSYMRNLSELTMIQLCNVMKTKQGLDNQTIKCIVEPHLPRGKKLTPQDVFNIKTRVKRRLLRQTPST